MLAQWTMIAQGFEAAMLVCFGISWPVAILKTWRTRRTEGKSLGFLMLIFVGYLAGVTSKFVRAAGQGSSLEMVTALYALNALFVGADIVLYFRFRPRPAQAAQG
jgi:hypothetical protein